MVVNELNAKALVDQQTGEHQERRTGNIEQRSHRVGQNVIEPRPPAIWPDVPESGHDAIRNDRLEVVRDVREGIEADRALDVGRVEIN